MLRTLSLQFDPSLPWGSKEHYFHALHGYMLPGLHHALAHGYGSVKFEDCGPLIQPRLVDSCALVGLTYVDPHALVDADVYRVPRWDRYLLHFDGPPPTASVIDWYRLMVTPMLQLMQFNAQSNLPEFYKQFDRETVAVIRRSDDHPFYHTARMASFPAFGAGRTALINVDEVAHRLRSEGIAAQIVEFGAMSLGQQILVASRARALVGIRGAEFANVIWMLPHTHAIMLATPVRDNHATRTLARIKCVQFSSIAVDAAKVCLDQTDQMTITQMLRQAPANEP